MYLCLDEDPCTLPPSVGQGRRDTLRSYYDSNLRQCVSFLYKGSKGNANNFVSLEQCQLACPPKPFACPNNSRPWYNQNGDLQHCNPQSTISNCKDGYWCHVGATLDSNMCCPNSKLCLSYREIEK